MNGEITEQDIRKIYEGAYRIAEEVGNSSFTLGLEDHVYSLLTHPIFGVQKIDRRVSETSLRIYRKEYAEKFMDLKDKQRGAQGQ